MNKNYSKSVVEQIKKFLTEDDWKYTFNDEVGIFSFGLRVRKPIKQLEYIISVEEDSFLVIAKTLLGPDSEDKEQMSRMMEFICRTNYGLRNGNFELDMNNGEILYKSFVDCEKSNPSKEVIRNSIHCPAAMFNRFGEGIMGIIYRDFTVEEAMQL